MAFVPPFERADWRAVLGVGKSPDAGDAAAQAASLNVTTGFRETTQYNIGQTMESVVQSIDDRVAALEKPAPMKDWTHNDPRVHQPDGLANMMKSEAITEMGFPCPPPEFSGDPSIKPPLGIKVNTSPATMTVQGSPDGENWHDLETSASGEDVRLHLENGGIHMAPVGERTPEELDARLIESKLMRDAEAARQRMIRARQKERLLKHIDQKISPPRVVDDDGNDLGWLDVDTGELVPNRTLDDPDPMKHPTLEEMASECDDVFEQLLEGLE